MRISDEKVLTDEQAEEISIWMAEAYESLDFMCKLWLNEKPTQEDMETAAMGLVAAGLKIGGIIGAPTERWLANLFSQSLVKEHIKLRGSAHACALAEVRKAEFENQTQKSPGDEPGQQGRNQQNYNATPRLQLLSEGE